MRQELLDQIKAQREWKAKERKLVMDEEERLLRWNKTDDKSLRLD